MVSTQLRESLLHFVWQHKRLDFRNLTTTDGDPVTLLQMGYPNSDSGPDFSQARMRIGDMIWAGHVEMHIRSSQWYEHKHHEDPAYDNVILHVVWEEDRPVYTRDGSVIPTLCLKDKIQNGLIERYEDLMLGMHWIPCGKQFREMNSTIRNVYLESLVIERLERKCAAFENILSQKNGDFESTLFSALARYLGMQVNADAMESLADSVPLKLMMQFRDQPEIHEALLFGQAGMLERDFNDAFPRKLKKEYAFLQKKYPLTPMQSHAWKFMRMRPANFPTIRIAQLSALYRKEPSLFSQVLEIRTFADLQHLFDVKPSDYWDDHYLFDSTSEIQEKPIGEAALLSLAINVIVPMQFLYGQHHGMQDRIEQSLDLLGNLPKEDNQIIRKWRELGWKARNAVHTQGLLELKTKRCDERRCMDCRIGHQIISG